MGSETLELMPGIMIPGPFPVVYLKNSRALVFADAHLGFEEEMAAHGLFLPRIQKKKLLEVLETVLGTVDVEWIVIAGDIKHQFGQLGRVERRELFDVLDFLSSRVNRVTIVRGNHDNYLPLVLRRYSNVELVEDYLVVGEEVLVLHGHKDVLPSNTGNYKLIIMGHEHPSLGLRDKLGYLIKYPCFLYTQLKNSETKLLVLPAIGAYQTGTSVSLEPSAYLSPIMRNKVLLNESKPIVYDSELGLLEFPKLETLFNVLSETVA